MLAKLASLAGVGLSVGAAVGLSFCVPVLLTAASCGGGNGDAGVQPAFTPTFTNVNGKIFQLSCTVSGCHTTGANASVGGLDLTNSPYFALLGDGGVPALDPGTLDSPYQERIDGGLVTLSYQKMLDGGLETLSDGGEIELDGGLVTLPDGGPVQLDGGPNFQPYNYHYNGMLLVTPGDPENSLLYQKLNAGSAAVAYCTQTDAGTCQFGQHMPNVEGEVLLPSYIETVREWIANGALNN